MVWVRHLPGTHWAGDLDPLIGITIPAAPAGYPSKDREFADDHQAPNVPDRLGKVSGQNKHCCWRSERSSDIFAACPFVSKVTYESV
jgi:hypothetical protein